MHGSTDSLRVGIIGIRRAWCASGHATSHAWKTHVSGGSSVVVLETVREAGGWAEVGLGTAVEVGRELNVLVLELSRRNKDDIGGRLLRAGGAIRNFGALSLAAASEGQALQRPL